MRTCAVLRGANKHPPPSERLRQSNGAGAAVAAAAVAHAIINHRSVHAGANNLRAGARARARERMDDMRIYLSVFAATAAAGRGRGGAAGWHTDGRLLCAIALMQTKHTLRHCDRRAQCVASQVHDVS